MSHTQLHYHIVSPTYYRTPWLVGKHLRFVANTMAKITRDAGGRPIAINGWRDHIHVLCDLPPRQDVASYVSKIKSQSTGAVRRKFSELEDFRWSVGYAAFTVSSRGLSSVRSYVRRQQEIHQRREAKPEHELPE